MIFGKTDTDRAIEDCEEQLQRVNELLPRIEYAWLPERLNNDNETNGRWIWLDYYISILVNKYDIKRVPEDDDEITLLRYNHLKAYSIATRRSPIKVEIDEKGKLLTKPTIENVVMLLEIPSEYYLSLLNYKERKLVELTQLKLNKLKGSK